MRSHRAGVREIARGFRRRTSPWTRHHHTTVLASGHDEYRDPEPHDGQRGVSGLNHIRSGGAFAAPPLRSFLKFFMKTEPLAKNESIVPNCAIATAQNPKATANATVTSKDKNISAVETGAIKPSSSFYEAVYYWILTRS